MQVLEQVNRVIYVEDDSGIAQIVKEYLEQRGCSVIIYATVMSVKQALQRHVPRIILLDWNMPDGRGDVLCEWIRFRWPEIPIIFLTVRNDTQDIVHGFQNGADDYVVKPFELEVLYSRISCGEIRIDKSKMMVTWQEKEIRMSQAEYQLLLLLMENKGKTVTRQQLLEQIWDCNGNYVNDNTLTVTMKRLREKLNQPSCLKTIRSFGYRMEDVI